MSVNFAAGATTATFTVTGQPDLHADGDQLVVILATAPGFVSGQASVTVEDRDVPWWNVTLSAIVVAEGETIIAHLTHNVETAGPLSFTIDVDDTSELQVPESVICASGVYEESFEHLGKDDAILDGTQVVSVKIVAPAPLQGDLTTQIRVLDRQAAMEIHPGWNLLGLALSPVDPRPAAVFPPEKRFTSPSWGWNGRAYTTGKDLQQGEAYWIFSSDTTTWILFVDGTYEARGVAIRPGWNFVAGVWGISPISQAAEPFLGCWFWWNAIEQSYEVLGDQELMTPGRGYWIYSTANSVISPIH